MRRVRLSEAFPAQAYACGLVRVVVSGFGVLPLDGARCRMLKVGQMHICWGSV